ncbi:MAG: DEAD/DEAH box helicase [Actinomycetota bacterium]
MPPSTSFTDLGVPTAIVDALSASGIKQPFAIQAETIPDLMAGRDVIGRAPTGSGKTLAFGIPAVALALEEGPARKKRPRVLILAPTRELAGQIHDELAPMLAAVDRHGLAVYGGVGLQPQINRLSKGVDVLVATPGRLEDLIQQRVVSLAEVEYVVIDEADRMADMGFMPAVKRLLDQAGDDPQTVLYSATLDGEVAKLTKAYQSDPVRHEVGEATPDLDKMTHYFWEIPRPERIPLCASVIATFGRTIVFTRTRHGADRAARQLSRAGVPAVPIHGNRSQNQRQRALDDFGKGKAAALVATDVAARGIHVDAVECVVHFDPVDEDSAYVHRSGRTARAGARGTVVSFVDPGQVKDVQKMKRRLELPQEITPPPEVDGTPFPHEELAANAAPATERPARSDRDRDDRPRKPKGQTKKRGGKPGAKANKRKAGPNSRGGQDRDEPGEGGRKPHRKGGYSQGPKPGTKAAKKRGGPNRGPKQSGPKAGGGRPGQKRSGGRPGQGKGGPKGQGGQRRRGQGRTS